MGQLGRSLPREWKHEVGKMGTGVASSHVACVLHKGFGCSDIWGLRLSWYDHHLLYGELHGRFAKRHGLLYNS